MDIADGPVPSASTRTHKHFSDALEQEAYFDTAYDRDTVELEYAYQLVDTLFELTDNLTDLSPRVIQKNPETILALRHLTRPNTSQKRCEKYIDVSDLSPYESGDRYLSDDAADKMYELVTEYMCCDIAPWVAEGRAPTEAELLKGRGQIATKLAQTRTEVFLRSYRKNIQEGRVHDVLEAGGYTEAESVSSITNPESLEVGEYVDETTVEATTSQKADSVFRMDDGRLGFIEAKVVGFEVDGSKRVKEFGHKGEDWWSEFPDAEVFAVISGDVKESVVKELYQAGVQVVWEHNLDNFGNQYALNSCEYEPVEHSNADLDPLPDDLQTRGRRNVDLDTYECDSGESDEIGSANSQRKLSQQKEPTPTNNTLTDY